MSKTVTMVSMYALAPIELEKTEHGAASRGAATMFKFEVGDECPERLIGWARFEAREALNGEPEMDELAMSVIAAGLRTLYPAEVEKTLLAVPKDKS